MSIYNWLAIYITSIAKKIAFVFLLFNAALQVVKHTSWIPGSSENYICYSHTLSFGLKCQKEFSCCLVWWKKSLEFYKTWCVHRGIPKLHCCIVKVCWLSFNWLLDRFESKKSRFLANSRRKAAPYRIQKSKLIYFCCWL